MEEKLLIVDDEKDIREWAAKFFRKRKIEVLTASSGEEAIEIVGREKPTAMLLDITMEGIDGSLRPCAGYGRWIRILKWLWLPEAKTKRRGIKPRN